MLITQRSLLFIGFGFGDEDIIDQLHKMNEIFANSAGPHYALVKKGSLIQERIKQFPVVPVLFEEYGDDLTSLVALIAAEAAPMESRSKPPKNDGIDPSLTLQSSLTGRLPIHLGINFSHCGRFLTVLSIPLT